MMFIFSSRQRSGADIKIQDPLPGKADRVITITGNPEQIQYGQFLMQQRCLAFLFLDYISQSFYESKTLQYPVCMYSVQYPADVTVTVLMYDANVCIEMYISLQNEAIKK